MGIYPPTHTPEQTRTRPREIVPPRKTVKNIATFHAKNDDIFPTLSHRFRYPLESCSKVEKVAKVGKSRKSKKLKVFLKVGKVARKSKVESFCRKSQKFSPKSKVVKVAKVEKVESCYSSVSVGSSKVEPSDK